LILNLKMNPRGGMADSDFTDEVWRALWASMASGAELGDDGEPSPAELWVLFTAASRLPPEKLRILLKAIRGASEH